MEDYGLALKKLRQHFSLTQRELGERVGISNHAISKWEHGINQPDISALRAICAVYGITTEDFFRIAAGEEVEAVLQTAKNPPIENETAGAGTRSRAKNALFQKHFDGNLDKPPVIVCIGSDLAIGDSLGPITGSMLKYKTQGLGVFVYGTLATPVTAKEIKYLRTFLRATNEGT